MRGLTFAAVLLASAVVTAEPSTLQEHLGPPGLKWGMHPADVRTALKGRFGAPRVSKVEGSPSTVLSFGGGTFDGLPAERIEAEFACDELRRFTVTFAASQAHPLDRLWQDVTSKMTEAHGEPAEQQEAPAAEAAKQGRLSATWRFARDRLVTVDAAVRKPDRQGRRQETVVWLFNDNGPETTRCLAQHTAE